MQDTPTQGISGTFESSLSAAFIISLAAKASKYRRINRTKNLRSELLTNIFYLFFIFAHLENVYALLYLSIVTLLTRVALGAGVTGSASGFVYGVTGGGSATPVTPTTNDELVSYLTDDVARVILITKTFNFIGSEGTNTATGCIPSSNTCGSSGQNTIDSANYCNPTYPSVSVTYDNAGVDPIEVVSDKSIVGVGYAGVIQGRGLRLYGVSNVIIQNVYITDLNPSLIWGGNAITLVSASCKWGDSGGGPQLTGKQQNTDMVWIDHCKFSLVGRQMIVTGFDAAGIVTISNNEFDGITS